MPPLGPRQALVHCGIGRCRASFSDAAFESRPARRNLWKRITSALFIEALMKRGEAAHEKRTKTTA